MFGPFLEDSVRGRIPPTANLEELKMALVEECDSLPLEKMDSIIQTVPDPIQAAVRARAVAISVSKI